MSSSDDFTPSESTIELTIQLTIAVDDPDALRALAQDGRIDLDVGKNINLRAATLRRPTVPSSGLISGRGL